VALVLAAAHPSPLTENVFDALFPKPYQPELLFFVLKLGSTLSQFRTFQVCPKDLASAPRQADFVAD
jgi:hypothetical protein